MVLIVLIVMAGVASPDDEQDQVADNSPSTSATESTSPQETTTVPEEGTTTTEQATTTTALTPATSTAPSTVTEAEEATLEPQGTPTIEEALSQFTLCQRLRVTVQMRWGQAPATIYADDPKVWGNLEEGDYVQFISGVQDNGVVRVKVFPHDGRAVGNTNDQVWIDWKGLTQNRLDQHALECED